MRSDRWQLSHGETPPGIMQTPFASKRNTDVKFPGTSMNQSLFRVSLPSNLTRETKPSELLLQSSVTPIRRQGHIRARTHALTHTEINRESERELERERERERGTERGREGEGGREGERGRERERRGQRGGRAGMEEEERELSLIHI